MSDHGQHRVNAAPADTGRRDAYVTFVDDNYFPGFMVLLKSLHLNNMGSRADLLVLHDGLSAPNMARTRALRPDVRFVSVNPAPYEAYVKGDPSNYLYTKAYFLLEAFRLRDYDRVVTLDTDMVVLRRIDQLFELEQGMSAVPQFFEPEGGKKINSGLLAFGRAYMSDEFVQRLDSIGRSGSYEVEKHDQGIISAALQGEYHALGREFNWVKRATRPGQAPPADTRVLHFTGRFKPWQGGEIEYHRLEELWRRYDMPDIAYMCGYLQAAEATGEGHPVLLAAYRQALENLPADARAQLAQATTLDDVDSVAASLTGDGDYAAALAVHRRVAGELGRVANLVQTAKLLRALGRYDDATALALLATTWRGSKAAEYFLAETAWIRRDDAAARTYTYRTLAIEPTHVKARAMLQRVAAGAPDTRIEATTRPGGLNLSHAAFYVDELGNFGDALLPVAVRESVAATRPVASWRGVHVHRVFDDEEVERANASDALLVGGGGLFLPDTMPNGNSGWQWNVPDSSLRGLTVPLALTAVGFNLFPGQRIYGTRFEESLRHTVERATLVGIRNHGSIDRVREHLPAELQERVTYMPCPTTFLGLLHHGPAVGLDPASDAARPVIHLNIAFDRSGRRFQDGYPGFLAQINRFVTETDFADVRIAAHTVGDERIAQDLYSVHGTHVPVDSIFRLDVRQGLELYARSSLVIGMRGHAGMIPFGVGTPIVSLVSHPKLRYFLEDIGHEEWGLAVDDEHLADRLKEISADVITVPHNYRADVSEARGMLRKAYDEALGVLMCTV